MKIYALGLTKKEYYKQWEQEHREMRNAYRRKKYREKCIRDINNERNNSNSFLSEENFKG